MSALSEADKLINGDRAKEYGPPNINFARIVRLWNAHLENLGIENPCLTTDDVAVMMTFVKLARHVEGYKHDTVVDAAGYIGILELLHNHEEGAIASDALRVAK